MNTTKRLVALLLVVGVAVLLWTTVSATALMVADPAKTEQVEKSTDQVAVTEVDEATDTATSVDADVDTTESEEIGPYSVGPDTAGCIDSGEGEEIGPSSVDPATAVCWDPGGCNTPCPAADCDPCCADHLWCCNQPTCVWNWTCCRDCEGYCACM